MDLDLYYLPGSPACRSVLITSKLVAIDFNLKMVDLDKGEHLKPEYLKINPQHSVPALVDHENEVTLIESRAIMQYLVNQCTPDHPLYPSDPRKRAMVDQRLFFDQGTLYSRFFDYYFNNFGVSTSIEYIPAKKARLEEALKLLDIFLEKSKYVAGNTLTIADITIYVSVSSLEACNHDLTPYKNIAKWYFQVKGDLIENGEDSEHLEGFQMWYEKLPKK